MDSGPAQPHERRALGLSAAGKYHTPSDILSSIPSYWDVRCYMGLDGRCTLRAMNSTLGEKVVHAAGSLFALGLILGYMLAVTVLAVIGWIIISLLFTAL